MPENSGALGILPYGVGVPQIIAGTSPAAGAGFELKLDSRFVWRFLAVKFQITTDANAANRVVTFDYADGNGTVFCTNGAGLLVTASTTALVFQGASHRGLAEWTSSGSSLTPVWFPIEPMYLVGSQRVQINVASVQAGDQLSAITLVAEQFTNKPEAV